MLNAGRTQPGVKIVACGDGGWIDMLDKLQPDIPFTSAQRLLYSVRGDGVAWSEDKDAPAKRLCGFVPAAGALKPCIVGSPGAERGLGVPYLLFCLGAQFAVSSMMAGS
jgi:hypothetical protein